MKSSCFVCVCVMCALATTIHGQVVNGINVISHDYYIRATWDETWRWRPAESLDTLPYPAGDWSAGYVISPTGEITGGYTLVGGSPVSATTGSPSPVGGYPLNAGASIDLFYLQNSAGAALNGRSYPAPIGGFAIFSGSIQTTAEATWHFHPIGNSIDIDIDAHFSNFYGTNFAGITATLMDVTPGHYSTLLNLVNANLKSHYTFATNPDDVYQFSIDGWSNTYSDDLAGMSFNASITSVPEPQTFSLLAIGMLGAAFVRAGQSAKHNRLN